MRKKFFLIMTLLCVLGLSGCSMGANWALPDKNEARIMARRQLEAISTEESFAMARYMCANRVYVSGDALYTLEFDLIHQPVLAAYDRAGTELSNFRILAADCVPEYLTEHEGKLYYINAWGGDYIETVDLESYEREIIVDRPSSALSIREGQLYYRNDRGWYCSAKLDGSGETVLLEKSCRYPYIWGEAILYQNEENEDRLHLYWPEDGTDICLTEGAAYAPMLLGNRLYFTEGSSLRSIGIDGRELRDYETRAITGAAEFMPIEGRWQARCITEDYGISQWWLEPESGDVGEEESELYRYCDFLGEDCRVDAVYFSDGRLRDFELISARGKSCRYIAGNISESD